MKNATELEILADVAGRLEAAGIDYMLTGSLAMSYYATPRMTRDIDIVVALDAQDGERIRQIFRDDYYLPEDSLRLALATQGMFNLVHLESVAKVDIIVRKDQEFRQAEFARRRRVAFAGVELWITSLEDLVLSKLVGPSNHTPSCNFGISKACWKATPTWTTFGNGRRNSASRIYWKNVSMHDTSPEVARFVRDRYAAMSGEERVLIAARMFDTAREIVLSSLPANLTPAERRRALCRRLYPELDDGAVFDAV